MLCSDLEKCRFRTVVPEKNRFFEARSGADAENACFFETNARPENRRRRKNYKQGTINGKSLRFQHHKTALSTTVRSDTDAL